MKLPVESGPAWYRVVSSKPFEPDSCQGSEPEVHIKVVYLNPVSDPRFYEHGHPADIELPPLWKPTYEEAQPLSCVDEWGQLFALDDGCYRLRSAEELRELELEGDARNSASAKVHKFYSNFLYVGRYRSLCQNPNVSAF